MNEYNQVELTGEWPNLIGLVLDELICIEMLYEGKVHERVNSVHFRFGDLWYRLYFDCGIIFWRKNEVPVEFEAPELNCSFKVVKLGENLRFNGKTIDSITPVSFDYGSEVRCVFSDSSHITFFDFADVADYKT